MGSVRDLKKEKEKEIKNNAKNYTPAQIRQAWLSVNRHKAYVISGK